MSDKYLLTASEIVELPGSERTHFLNNNARRNNKSLGDITGLTGLGFHIIEVEPGLESTEYHKHHYEDECTYVLSGNGVVTIGDDNFDIGVGDFIGYRAGGLAHTMRAVGIEKLVCIVVGQRLAHDVGDYPNVEKRIYRNQGLAWDVVDHKFIDNPQKSGKK